jgi:thymidylate synthase (FAD)
VRVHYEPEVVLVGRPALVPEGVDRVLREYPGREGETHATWWRDLGDAEGDALPELMGRLCYGSFGPAQGRAGSVPYMRNILEQGHGSVLEHAQWSFVVLHGSRALSDQVRTHRAGWAHSVESTHFVRFGVGSGVCLPGMVPGEDATAVAIGALNEALERYDRVWRMVEADLDEAMRSQASGPEAGRARRRKKAVCAAARQLLPLGVETRHGFSANARALRHFVELRGARDNVPEARLLAAGVARIMQDEAPATFQDVDVPRDAGDGLPEVRVSHRKV